jgi:pimeloyl-ACP methyl ester carboxylesterase
MPDRCAATADPQPGRYSRREGSASDGPMPPVRTTHVWRAPGGLWSYDCWGRNGRPVLLIPAVLFDRVMWWPAAADLRAHATVVAVDLPGHGGSTRRASYDAHEIVDDLARLLHHLDLRQAPVLVGHASSAFLVELFATRYATHAVVTVDPSEIAAARADDKLPEVDAYLADLRLDAVPARYRDFVTPVHDQALLAAYTGGKPDDRPVASRPAGFPARLTVHSRPPVRIPQTRTPSELGRSRQEIYHVDGRFAHLADASRFFGDVRALL